GGGRRWSQGTRFEPLLNQVLTCAVLAVAPDCQALMVGTFSYLTLLTFQVMRAGNTGRPAWASASAAAWFAAAISLLSRGARSRGMELLAIERAHPVVFRDTLAATTHAGGQPAQDGHNGLGVRVDLADDLLVDAAEHAPDDDEALGHGRNLERDVVRHVVARRRLRRRLDQRLRAAREPHADHAGAVEVAGADREDDLVAGPVGEPVAEAGGHDLAVGAVDHERLVRAVKAEHRLVFAGVADRLGGGDRQAYVATLRHVVEAQEAGLIDFRNAVHVRVPFVCRHDVRSAARCSVGPDVGWRAMTVAGGDGGR